METSNQRKQIEQYLIEKAMKDETFRKRLLENPKETIEQESRLKLPDSINIRVLQEDSETVYLVLPRTTDGAQEDELTETELASVAGGADGYSNGCNETYALFCH
ncbi:MAG: NHLP leader peptide family RiPP precursor [Bacteroidetes bacterium]|nr:NHLP leader peptide family RiPP precursor [Bacteroidota bacterium]